MSRLKFSIKREVIESFLEFAREMHPKEAILLIRGKKKGESYQLEELVFPPQAVSGESFSSFNMHMLPLDLSLLGVAHSHPSGFATPSVWDLNHIFGVLIMITAHPYREVRLFNSKGEAINFQIV